MRTQLTKMLEGKNAQRELDSTLNEVLVYIESSLALDGKLHPRQCACGCGEIENLQSGWTGGKLIYLCPAAAREANNPRM